MVPVSHKLAEHTGTSTAIVEVVADKVKMQLQRNVSSKSTSEFFIMRVVHEKQEANMELQIFTENVQGLEVKVPCAVNFKDVNNKDEIVLYKPQVKNTPKAKVVAAVLEPATKKSKTAL